MSNRGGSADVRIACSGLEIHYVRSSELFTSENRRNVVSYTTKMVGLKLPKKWVKITAIPFGGLL